MSTPASAFPRLSPSGRRVVAGERVIVVDGVRDIGPGTSAQWASEDRLYYTRQPDGAFVTRVVGDPAPTVVRAREFNSFSAPSLGRWAGYDAGFNAVRFDNGTMLAGCMSPALSTDPSVWAVVQRAGGSLLTESGPPPQYAGPGRADGPPRFAGQVLAWSVLADGRWQVAGRRRPQETPALLAVEREEFSPVPVIARDGAPWLLTASHTRLLLRPWGDVTGYIVVTGDTLLTPDVRVMDDGRFRVVWDAGHNVLGDVLVDPRTPRVDLRETPEPDMQTPGVQITRFDPVVRPGQPWRIEFHDRNNPAALEHCVVEFENGQVRVLIKNEAGEDRSGPSRPVEVRCAE